MMKFSVIVMFTLIAQVSFGLNLNVTKMRTINGQPAKGGNKIFSRQWSRHFYQISLVGANPKDCDVEWKIRVLPILKGCRGGDAFPFMKGICEQNGITVDQQRKWVCVYVSPLVIWTKDTWTDVGSDLSHGFVNNSIAVELLKVYDGKEEVVRYWTNSPMSAYRSAKSIDC